MPHIIRPPTATRRAILTASAGSFLAGATPALAATDLTVAGNTAHFGRSRYRCAVGYAGVRADKKEGDGATPAGSWPIRYVLFRPDRVRVPKMKFDVRELKPNDGWCDAPADANYNRPVQLPYAASAETLWRKDGIYDVIAVLGYNDDPVVPGRGSAIFLHIARANYSPTVGCIALARENLLAFLSKATPATRVVIRR